MARKPVARVPSEELPDYMCSQCYFYEPVELDHGACYGVPPFCVVDSEDGMSFPRVIVLPEDRGCIHWRARHKA